jgi:arylsulfatase A-like enzyme
MGRPNLVVVVLDCVRAWDFPGGPDAVAGLWSFEALRRDAWEFPRAASVAHWTVPAHSSLFTGRYPWEHGVHAKGRLAVPSDMPQMDAVLRRAGYATFSASANGLISPALGFTSGCERAAWGVSLFNRVSTRQTPPQGAGSDARRSAAAEGFVRNRLKPLSYWTAVYMARYPGFWDLGTRAVHNLRGGNGTSPPRMAQWLEPTLERWLRATPAERPVYCFVNLLDAHEPYLSDPEAPAISAAWRDYARTRQDRLGWVSGRWLPTAVEFERLHGLYRSTLELLDRRVGRIIEILRRTGRWDETMFILTSDHGQAFGEHGTLFHIAGIDEPEVRIPLLFRPPGGVSGGRRAMGWASLVDIAPTFYEAAGLDAASTGLPGLSLTRLTEGPRPGPVYAMNDGLVHAPDAARAPTERRARLDRLLVGAYIDDRKLVYDPAIGQARAFDVARDRFETTDLWESERADFAPLEDVSTEIGRRLLGGNASSMGTDVEDRLKSWGYI